MNQWLRRGALGCVVGLSVLAAPTAAFAYGPGGAGNGFGLGLSASVGVGGASVTVSAASGQCTPGSVAQISLIRAIASQTPALLGTATVSASGGIDATTVVIPVGSPVGVYILFSTCSAAGGATDVFTASYVVDGPIASGSTAYYAPPSSAPPSSVSLAPNWGTPATRAAVQPALTATASQVVNTVSADSSGSTSSGSAQASATGASSAGATTASTNSNKKHLVAAGLTRPSSPNNHLLITWLIVAAVVVGLSTTGLLVLRRRRPAGH